MLFAFSVQVSLGKKNRRLDLIIEAVDSLEAEAKALQQAKRLYHPGKKATYTVIKSVSETEALEVFPPSI
jgi:propanediol utilization protein